MAPGGRLANEYLSWPGLLTVGLGYGCYWLSTRSGKKAAELEKVPRLESLAELKKLERGSALPTVASVSGRVFSEQPLSCENVPDLGVIHRSITKEVFMKKNDRGEWKRDNSTITDFTRETQWHLGDSSNVKLGVRDGKSASGLELKAVYVGFQSDGAGDDVATSLFKVGADLWQGVKKIGTEKSEGILPLGTTVTAVGEMTKVAGTASRSGSNWAAEYMLQRPMNGPFYITTQTMPELIQSLSRSSKRWWYVGLGFTCLGSFFVLKKVYKKLLQEHRMRQFKRDMQTHLERLEDEGGDPPGDTENLCITCMEKKYDAVFVNCGHMCCCYECARKMKKCPICRQESKVTRVYSA